MLRKLLSSVALVAALALPQVALADIAPGGKDDHAGHDHAGHDHGAPSNPAEHAAAPDAHGEGGEAHGGDAHHGGAHAVHSPISNFLNFSYSGKNTEGGEYKEGDHKMPAPFAMALLNFAILLFLFFKYAAPGFKKTVRDRHDEVAKQLAESAKLRDEAAAKLAEYEQKVSSLDADIAKLVDGIRSEAENEKQRIVGEAETRAARLRKDAEQQIQAEIARVRVALEREVTLTALAAAEKLLRDKTSDADHRALADSFVQKLGQTPRA